MRIFKRKAPVTRQCGACGQDIIVVNTPNGKTIPLDKAATQKWVVFTEATGLLTEPVNAMEFPTHEDHRLTCSGRKHEA